jgi:hypothetical protein
VGPCVDKAWRVKKELALLRQVTWMKKIDAAYQMRSRAW